MDRSGLIEFLKGELAQKSSDEKKGVAVNIHFHDALQAFITPQQWSDFFRWGDRITLKRKRRQALLEALVKSLGSIAREVCGKDDTLTLILYGIVTHSGQDLDLFVLLSHKGCVEIGRLKPYRLKAPA